VLEVGDHKQGVEDFTLQTWTMILHLADSIHLHSAIHLIYLENFLVAMIRFKTSWILLQIRLAVLE
jgi:hypothetical protein